MSPVGSVTALVESLQLPEFMRYGDCSQTDPEVFFPEKGGSTAPAKRICGGCSVRAECLEFALARDERFGVWGGTSERERRRITAQRRQAQAAEEVAA